MSNKVKIALICVVAFGGAKFVVDTFTSANDTPTEKLMWGAGSAFALGLAAASIL